MRQSGHSHFAGYVTKGALLCGLVLLLWPASASADIGRCVEDSVSEMAEQGVGSLLWMTPSQAESSQSMPSSAVSTTPPAETPCTEDPDADPSSNFCFEDAEGQISTLPRLLAQWQGERAAGTVIDSMLAAMERVDAQPEAALAAESLDIEVDFEPTGDPDGESCQDNPDECRSLPPAPPTLTVDASSAAARRLHYHTELPPRLSTDDPRAWAQLRVGPHHGHRDPPEQPPRA